MQKDNVVVGWSRFLGGIPGVWGLCALEDVRHGSGWLAFLPLLARCYVPRRARVLQGIGYHGLLRRLYQRDCSGRGLTCAAVRPRKLHLSGEPSTERRMDATHVSRTSCGTWVDTATVM